MVTISVVAGLLVLLAVAVQYTTQVSRNTQRSRKTALAMEIADGHLEALFTQLAKHLPQHLDDSL